MVEVSEGEAGLILCLNIFTTCWGTGASACMDRKGYNCNAYMLGTLHAILWPVFGLGWFLAMGHSYAVIEHNKGRK